MTDQAGSSYPGGHSRPPTGPTSNGAVAPVMRCVIWHSPAATGTQLPGELLTSLSKRVGRMTICTSDYVALAECCLIERNRRLEISTGARAASGGVLVLVQPSVLRGVGRLMEAMQTHAPSMAAWIFDKGANPKLRAVVEDDVTAWLAAHPVAHAPAPTVHVRPVAPAPRPAAPVAQPRPQQNGPRLVGEPARPSNGAAHAAPRRTGSILTEDELRMLLSGDTEPGSAPQPPLGPRRGPQPPSNGRGGMP